MAASVGPDGGGYIGQHLLIDRFLGTASAESMCCCLVVPINVVAQLERWMECWLARRLTSTPWTLADLDDATGDRTDLLAHQLGYVGMRARLSEQS
jgi:hypothetical protein